jgi:hypothetical protein
VKIFLSYGHQDSDVADYLRVRFEQLLGIEMFVMPYAAVPGDDWMDRLRDGAHECDELLTVVTPESVGLPWVIAEWACFWLLQKRRTPLLVEIGVSQLWDGMRRSQAVDLLDSSRTTALIRRLSDMTGNAVDAPDLARQMSVDIPLLREGQSRRDVSAALADIRANLAAGTDNVSPRDVAAVISAERVGELVALVLGPESTDVKRKQVGRVLVEHGQWDAALHVCLAIDNRNERKNVALAAVDQLTQASLFDDMPWRFLLDLCPHLGEPRIRTIRQTLVSRGLPTPGCYEEGP